MRTEAFTNLVTSSGYMNLSPSDITALAEFRKIEILGLHHAMQIANPDLRMFAKSVVGAIQESLDNKLVEKNVT